MQLLPWMPQQKQQSCALTLQAADKGWLRMPQPKWMSNHSAWSSWFWSLSLVASPRFCTSFVFSNSMDLWCRWWENASISSFHFQYTFWCGLWYLLFALKRCKLKSQWVLEHPILTWVRSLGKSCKLTETRLEISYQLLTTPWQRSWRMAKARQRRK